MPALTLRRAANRLRRAGPPHQRDLPAGASISLASLRARLDPESRKTKWAVHPDGVLGRALVCEAGAASTVVLRLTGIVGLTARAMLLPHDWRDLDGAMRAWVAVTDAHGRRQELWGGELEASDRSHPRGHAVSIQIPADSTTLTLGVTPLHTASASPLHRAIFLEPTIIDPHAPAPTPPPPQRPALAPPPAEDPLISVLVPVHDPSLHMLEEAITSVCTQTFPHWQLCLVDDGCTHPEIIAALTHHAAADPRIHLTRHTHAQGISAATNAALATATGTYIALLDHDDTLTPDALQHVADHIAAQPDLDMIYTDEDVVADDGSFQRHIKPGWSPEHMSALMYTCHLGVYRRSLTQELGGFQSRYDGCQDYDFVLRLSERTDRIAHIPRILYHWRAHAASTAGGDQAKPYAYLAQPGAITDHLDRSRVEADVQFGQLAGLHRIVHRVDSGMGVDLVLAVDAAEGLAEAAASWAAQPHPTWSVVLAAPPEVLDAAVAALTEAGIPASRITPVPAPAGASSAGLASAAAAATAEQFLLMQTPAIGLTRDWLTRLIGYSQQPQIAAAGPIVLGPDGRIQQAGIALPTGVPLHLRHGATAAAALPVVYNVSAVSGILATRSDTYHRVGGLDPAGNDLALIDYCLRATTTGQRVVVVPDARLRTSGPDATVNDLATIWRLRETWIHTHTHDPYYNPNYRPDRGDFVLRRY